MPRARVAGVNLLYSHNYYRAPRQSLARARLSLVYPMAIRYTWVDRSPARQPPESRLRRGQAPRDIMCKDKDTHRAQTPRRFENPEAENTTGPLQFGAHSPALTIVKCCLLGMGPRKNLRWSEMEANRASVHCQCDTLVRIHAGPGTGGTCVIDCVWMV